ncbi:hypothetical protein [Clostridium minihomine]|nr:hypothetical protein [Clostridium minihomine]
MRKQPNLPSDGVTAVSRRVTRKQAAAPVCPRKQRARTLSRRTHYGEQRE